jgi:hypothetical protein
LAVVNPCVLSTSNLPPYPILPHIFVIASERRERRNLMAKIIEEIAEPVPSHVLSKKAHR